MRLVVNGPLNVTKSAVLQKGSRGTPFFLSDTFLGRVSQEFLGVSGDPLYLSYLLGETIANCRGNNTKDRGPNNTNERG